jgi:hypothetical protein
MALAASPGSARRGGQQLAGRVRSVPRSGEEAVGVARGVDVEAHQVAGVVDAVDRGRARPVRVVDDREAVPRGPGEALQSVGVAAGVNTPTTSSLSLTPRAMVEEAPGTDSVMKRPQRVLRNPSVTLLRLT